MIASETTSDFVTFKIGGQLFGVPIHEVQDVFKPQRLTSVPLAHPDIAGVLNLRGRIVTMIDCNRHLGGTVQAERDQVMAVGVERDGKSYGLLIDEVGDVLSLDLAQFEPNPINLDAGWSAVSKGVYRLEAGLLVVLNIGSVLDFGAKAAV